MAWRYPYSTYKPLQNILTFLFGLRETQNALQLTVLLLLVTLYPEYRGIRRAKNYFIDHRTANTIHGFRDSVPVLKIQGCY